jgi:hypothetical protein
MMFHSVDVPLCGTSKLPLGPLLQKRTQNLIIQGKLRESHKVHTKCLHTKCFDKSQNVLHTKCFRFHRRSCIFDKELVVVEGYFKVST